MQKTVEYLEREDADLNAQAHQEVKISPQPETSASIVALQGQIFSQLSKDTKIQRENLKITLEVIEKLETEIEGIPSEDAIAGILQKRQDLEKRKASILLDVERNQKEAEKRNNDLDRSRQNLRKVYEKAIYSKQGHEDDHRLIQFSTKSRSTLKKFREQVIDRHLHRIQRLVFESFMLLARKVTLVSKLEIDRRNYSIRLFDLDGKAFGAERLSAGERQLLSIAILWGLSKASGRPLPIVIDTPLGRLDGIHKSNLISRYFPHAGHQVILLSTDEEIGSVEKTQLQPSIGREYTLAYDDKTRSTTITSGYSLAGEIQRVS